MSVVIKSLSVDFNDNLKSNFFTSVEESSISPNLVSIITKGDIVTITFDAILSGSEQSQLDTLITNYTPEITQRKHSFVTIPVSKNKIKSADYYLTTNFHFIGTDLAGPISNFELVGYKHDDIDSYDAKIIDYDTGNVLVEKLGINNNELSNIDLGPISNVPTGDSNLELHIRRNGGTTCVHISYLMMYYD